MRREIVKKLEEELEKTRELIESLKKATRNRDMETGDNIDQAHLALSTATNHNCLDRQLKRQEALIKALEKIKGGGEYGICVDCRKDIPVERLMVCPETDRCFSCQNSRDRQVQGVFAGR